MPDARIAETFWTGQTGRRLRTHPAEVREVAVYLLTAPGKSLYGLYYKTLTSMREETGRAEKSIRHALAVLDDETFACYDDVNEYVWVVEMAAYQLGPLPLHAGDFRVTNANRWYHRCPPNIFLGAFFDRYGDDLRLVGPRRVWNPTPTLVAPAEQGAATVSEADKPLVQIVPDRSTHDVLIPELSDAGPFSVAEGFEEFWQAYPRPVGKQAAKKEYYAAKPTRALHDRILAALDQQKRGNRRWLEEGGRWIPNPSTWLYQGRWDDRPVQLPNVSAKTAASIEAVQRFVKRSQAKESLP